MFDRYCKVYLLPDKTKAGKKKTTTRKKTLQPEWEEILEVFDILNDPHINVILYWTPGEAGRIL